MMRIEHIALWTDDLERSVEFYRRRCSTALGAPATATTRVSCSTRTETESRSRRKHAYVRDVIACRRFSATRIALAAIVSAGLTAADDGKGELSASHTLSTSCK